jgi:hypothetical protein
MGGKSLVLAACVAFSFIALSSSAGAHSLYATTNKLVYASNDTFIVSGNITDYMDAVNINVTVSNSTPIVLSNMSWNGSGSNIFQFGYWFSSMPEGEYNVSVTDGSSTVTMRIHVVSQITYLETHLINVQDIIPVVTNTTITTDNAMGGNFSELRNLSISGTLHYGNATVGSGVYHFALVDQNYNSAYDVLYLDDDKRFQLYNDSEDTGNESMTERILKKGQKFGDYVLEEIEFIGGNKVVLGKPRGSSVYSPGSAVNFVVITKDEYKNFLPGIMVQVRLLNSSKGVAASFTNTTNSMGFFISNFTAPSAAGTYTIDLNNSRGMGFFTVESFKLTGKVTDLSGNPAYSFTPNSIARIYANSRDAGGNAVNLTSGSVRVTYPNGTAVAASLIQSETGIYYYDFSAGSATGNYGVKITGSYGGSTQEFMAGFEVQSTSMMVMAMNMNFIDQTGEGGPSEVNAFAPSENVTLMVFLSNISAGGMMAKGPEGMGLIDIDNSSTPTDECSTAVSLTELMDDRGIELSIPTHDIVNISSAIAMAGVSLQEQPPAQVMTQCAVIFPAPNRTGTYKAVVQLNNNGEIKKAGASFGIQRLYATGASVDSKGDDYWFFAPNTTMKIKLKINNLATRQDLSADNIIDAKITEMYKEFPDYQDVFTGTYRSTASMNISNGTLVFNAPDSEGFFSLKFRFRANVNGTEESGTGNAFFQLKKYMIWANPQCGQQSFGPCVTGINNSVNLAVNVVDIDQGSMMSQMGKGTSSLTCTNCDGLVVDVSSLRNDQLMKEMVKDVDYSVVKGAVSNATANLTIVPLSSKMQSGWYGMDLIATDPTNTNNTYFGWGGFEIRNFYVETMKIDSNGTAYFGSWDMGPVFPKGSSVAFAVTARDPASGEVIPFTSSPSLESVRWMVGWPPAEIPTGTLTVSISELPVYIQGNPGTVNLTVINITGLGKDGDFQANVRVTTPRGSDVGSFFFGMSTYNIYISYRGQDEWRATFSSSENITANFTAWNFDKTPHNLSSAGSKLKVIYDQKTGNPIRPNSSTSCGAFYCVITANLSSLQSGWYSAEFVINDSQGYEKQQRIEFMVQNVMLGIPSIEEAGVWYSDTPSREIEVNNDRDRCDNQLSFGGNWVDDQWNNWTFCVLDSGEWNSQACGGEGPPGTNTTILSNGSSLSINGTNYTAGSNFSLAGKNWTIVSIGGQQNSSFHINSTNGICGDMWTNCGEQGCQQSGYIMSPPSNYSTFYHGFMENLVSSGDFDRVLSRSENRSLYFYHNTSHAYINVSKSRSGVIKIGWIEEFRLGGWDKNSGQNRGLDLDGDGYANGTACIAIADSQTAGIYDTFFFFNQTGDYKFSANLSVSDSNTSNKVFGRNDTVILLSIDPRADRVRFYSDKIGDWASLGDFRMEGNVSIPVIVKSPNGSAVSANVSVQNVRVIKTATNQVYSLNPVPNATINGTGELRITNISQYGLGTGEYVFEIRATLGQNTEMLEEWKWPRAYPRVFLVDGYTGQAGYVSGFAPLNITRYDWENYGEILQVYTINWTNVSKYFRAVLDFAGGGDQVQDLGACNFVKPASAGDNNSNLTLRSNRLTNPQYYYYITAANASKVWIKTGDCNFTANTTEYDAATNPIINVTRNGRKYMMRVLDADIGNGSVFIGIKTSDFPANISAVSVNMWGPPGEQAESPTWYIMGLNISGTDYNVVLANDSTDYPMCSVWNTRDCAKRAWFSTSDNFSQAVPVFAGENFTSQLYLTRLGPGPWDGISIANFSLLEALPKPAIDIRVKDNTTSYYGVLSEAGLNLDLNMDGAKNTTFYAVAYDDLDDGQQLRNQIVVDDDVNITEEWWSSSNTNTSVLFRKDFYSSESGGISEKRGSLPTSIWSGNIRFGDQRNGSWEQQPEWRIEKYNGTDMLLLKDEWQINGTRNITILIRAYNFNQSPIQGANISIQSIRGNIPGMGFWKLNESNYAVLNVMNVTNQDGYGILKIIPAGTWSGEYMVAIATAYNGNAEVTDKWFRVM